MTFKVLLQSSWYVQILHVGGNSWVTVANMDLYSTKGDADRVVIFDSQLAKKTNLDLKKKLCSFIRPLKLCLDLT